MDDHRAPIRLPGGGGYPITIYTPTAAAAARAAQNYVTFETDFGPARTNYWQGVDFTIARGSARLTSRAAPHRPRDHRHVRDVLNIDSPDPRSCRSVEPFRPPSAAWRPTRCRRSDVLVSATVRSQPALLSARQIR